MTIKQPLWHSLTIEQVLTELKTNRAGLSSKEAEKRLKHFGLNKLAAEKPVSPITILLNQLKSPLIYILLLAAVIAFFIREFDETVVILAVVILNTAIGFFQEAKANQAIFRLKELIEYKATVRRAGQSQEINVAQLVPGDIIVIKAGDKIPADARLIEAYNLEVVEAALTGESMPSTKSVKKLTEGVMAADRENMVYLGTVAERGKGLAVVTATGQQTELGEVATLIQATSEDQTPLQKKLGQFSRHFGLIVLFISLLILAEGLIRHQDFPAMLILAIALAVAAIPEGLPIALTVILALGMQLILKQKALVRKLIAAETLGSTTVICTDKTGTLTEGKMQVAQILSGFEKLSDKKPGRERLVLTIGLLCNDAVIENPIAGLEEWRLIGDPTEQALLLAAVEGGLNQAELKKKYKRLSEIPFDTDIKFMATLHHWNEEHNIIYLKGAPEKVLAMSEEIKADGENVKLTAERNRKLKEYYEDLTNSGLRVLAVGYKLVGKKVKELKRRDFFNEQGEIIFKGLTFGGVLGLKDPLRPEAKETISQCHQAGLKPIIVTGDHKLTAKAIAQEVGLTTNESSILAGSELDKLDQAAFYKIVKKINVYTRVEPRHKLRIIDAWQQQGEVVAMTGDGINDAPAIKAADIGIALGSGTDVAKETADIILLDNNFRTIVAAIKQGRVMFDNLRKVIVYLLSNNFTEMILIGGALLFGLPLPLLAVQILWVNLVADGLPSFALAWEKEERGVMTERPRPAKEPLMNKPMKTLIFLIGLVTDLVLLAIFWRFWQITQDIAYVRTFIFITLGVNSLFYIFSCRSLREPIWRQNILANKFLAVSVLIGLACLLAAVYLPGLRLLLRTVPLSAGDWLGIALIGLFNITAIEAAKRFLVNRRLKTN